MCGIFGIVSKCEGNFTKSKYLETYKKLFELSESRGKEASGFALREDQNIKYLKTPHTASVLVNSNLFKDTIKNYLANEHRLYSSIGHSRLVTNGYEQDNTNNQPVAKNGVVAVHNGIIVNNAQIWSNHTDQERVSNLDSELIPTLISKYINSGVTVVNAVKKLYSEIIGMTNIAVLESSIEGLLLATNNGSLYYCVSNDNSTFIFGSERFILNKLIEEENLDNFSIKKITQLLPGQIMCLQNDLVPQVFDERAAISDMQHDASLKPLELIEIQGKVSGREAPRNTSMEYNFKPISNDFQNLVDRRTNQIKDLKRCSCCVLPETFPFIAFDSNGVCNYCNSYNKLEFKGEQAFKTLLYQYKSENKSKHDCLMPFSGGRDSSYALHYVKKELGLNPIAYSYDWGMLTDLARRNQARMCGELGVEHILISADIRKKRYNIRQNVSAWLKRPNLGTIPLFMAGDKQYFYYANLLMKQNDLELSIMGENMLETTRFKTGFCGIKPHFDNDKTYSLTLADKLKMLAFYGKEYILNPSYINSSLIDTLDAFKSYYVMDHKNVNMFDYLPWIEQEVEDVLINQYDWETDPGTKSTWRIGDGTAAFYNYIYYVVAGFTENDTFRSNQIREGLITREEAISKISTENQPRWESIQWYCNTINIDFTKAITIINDIPSLYEKS